MEIYFRLSPLAMNQIVHAATGENINKIGVKSFYSAKSKNICNTAYTKEDHRFFFPEKGGKVMIMSRDSPKSPSETLYEFFPKTCSILKKQFFGLAGAVVTKVQIKIYKHS